MTVVRFANEKLFCCSADVSFCDWTFPQVPYHLHPLEEEAEECLPPYLLLIVPVDQADPLYPQTLPEGQVFLHHPLTPSMASSALLHLPQV